MALFPKEDWDMLSHVLIFHGRRVCYARKPLCAICVVNDLCPSAFKAENVGRKPARIRLHPAPRRRVRVEPSRSKKKSAKTGRKKTAKTAKEKSAKVAKV
jgi:adenine-specific DNA glycosylase